MLHIAVYKEFERYNEQWLMLFKLYNLYTIEESELMNLQLIGFDAVQIHKHVFKELVTGPR